VPTRGHREPASHPRPVLDHDQVLIGRRARQETQTRGGPEPNRAAPLVGQTLKTGVTVPLLTGLARERPCGPGRSMRGAGPAHGRSLGSQDGGRERALVRAWPGSAARTRALSPFSDRCL
jgi:hypothetical protein